MKRWLSILAFCFLPGMAAAQTTVNLSVTDTPDNQAWNNGTWSVVITTPAGAPTPGFPYKVGSGGGSVAPQSGTLSGTGTASISLPANVNILPSQSVWSFQVCPQGTPGPACFLQQVTVGTSSPQTLALTPPSIRINLATTTPPASAYADAEIVNVVYGSTYFNVTSNGQRWCQTVVGQLCTLWTGPSGTGTFNNLTVSGALNSNNLAAGNVANKPAVSDALFFLSNNGNDSNDGRSPGSAYLTFGQAQTTCNNSSVPCTIHILAGYSQTLTAGGDNFTTANITVICEPGAQIIWPLGTVATTIGFFAANQGMYGCTLIGPGPSFAGWTSQAVVSRGDNFVFDHNVVKNFPLSGGTGTYLAQSGNHGKITNNNFSNDKENDIFLNTNTVSGTMLDWVITNNTAGEIIVHATAASSVITQVDISSNHLFNGQNSKIEFCEEVGTFGGSSVSDVTSAHNICVAQANGVDGGFSFSGPANNMTETADIWDSNGKTFTLPSFEHVVLSNSVIQGNISINGTGGNGLTCDRCTNSTFTGNTVNGFATAASGFGMHVNVSSTSSPTSSDNTITGNVIIFPAAGAGKGIWEQCNATGASCLNNTHDNNHILGTGAVGSIGILLEDDTGTFTNTLVGPNQITNVATGITVGSGVSAAKIYRGALASVTTAISDSGTGTLYDVPASAGGSDLGSTALPFGNLWLGTAATNNFRFSPAALSAARVINLLDPGANSNLGLNFNVTSGTYVSKRGVSGCTTAASIGGICASAVTITWPGTFPDTNYSAGCSPSGGPTNLPSAPYIVSKANGSMTVNYFAISAAAASWATLDCWAIHD